MTKEELARAIFEEQNKLRVLRGEEPIAPDSPRAQGKIWEDTKRTKPNLERELEAVRNSCDTLTAKKEHEAKAAAYFATPEGAALKAETEAAIEKKAAEWEAFVAPFQLAGTGRSDEKWQLCERIFSLTDAVALAAQKNG